MRRSRPIGNRHLSKPSRRGASTAMLLKVALLKAVLLKAVLLKAVLSKAVPLKPQLPSASQTVYSMAAPLRRRRPMLARHL